MTDTRARLGTALAGRYEIERELGAGGMATVYLAQDVRHDRRVALKVLRPELAAVIGAERFLAEIKTTANLQHPHILALFDSGEADGFLFYVMPYVEGESLRDRLEHEKQLPVAEAVRIATEVASALDYAHRHHVIHRDIKPENILLHDGQALVADFGIALAVSTAGNTRMTETGMSLGTPFYMSPEQAMGEREITARSDVYALGAVLYEMLTGEPPFTGPTAQAIIAKVVTEEPRRLTPKRHTIPPHVEDAVLTALEKLAADRFASAAEFAAALKDPGYRAAASTVAIPAAGARAARGRPGLLVTGAMLLVGLALGAVLFALLRPKPRPPVIRYGLSLPASQPPDPTWIAAPSPDGSRIAYVGAADGQLWIKDRDHYEARPLAGSQGAVNFTWSPDGQWIAFIAGRELRKIPVVGGAPVTVADSASGNMGIAWLDDGTIVYIQSGGTGLRRTAAGGASSRGIYSDSGNIEKLTPLPGSRGVLFARCSGSCNTTQELWAFDLRQGTAHMVMPGVALGQYLPTGHLMTIRGDGAMFVVPFDLKQLVTTGPPIPITDSVSVVNGVLPLAAVSASGTLVMRQGAALSLLQWYQMVWIDRSGRETPVDPSWQFRLTNYGANYGWSLSPDGSRLAIGLFTDAGDDIWVKQLPRGPLSRVSFDSASEFRPRWMPDGRSVMFSSNRQGDLGIGGLYIRRADGTGEDSLLLRDRAGIFEADWSPDRQWLLFRTGGTIGLSGGRDIVGLRPGVDSAPVPVIATPYDEEAIAISPNGRWLAYESNETGRTEVFLRPFPNTQSGKRQVSNGGGVAPLWRRDGRELYYVDAGRNMMAVSVAGTGDELGERKQLFHLDDQIYLSSSEFYTPYDIAPDGRFLMARNVTKASEIEVPLIVVENWFEEVRQRTGQ